MARELHNAKMYIKADKSTRDDIAASNRNIVEEGVKEMNELKRKYETSMHEIVEELVAKIDGDILEKKSLTDKASQVVNDKIELLKSWTSSSKDRKIDPITDPNIVRTQITEGPNSIIKNLPLPDVQPSTGTDDHSDVMGKLRSEIKQLEEPRKRYCGIVSYSERSLAVERALAEDQPNLLSDVVPTVVVTSAMLAIQNDHPERSKNTMTTQNGTYTRRWGHSTEFDAPNPNEAPVYNENDSNGDSDDDSLPELS